ncbi:MAG: tRNA adenosine(34) deaminase TadA [Bacillota bacterium]
MESGCRIHEKMMGAALNEARRALEKKEVPIGAVVVSAAGEILGRGHNLRETTGDPTAHAEIAALRSAGEARGDWRLEGCDLYVTVEPCPMCAGAAVNARIQRIIFGVRDPKAGAVVSLMSLTSDVRLNHQVEVIEGVRGDECASILQEFFRRLRTGR